MSEKVVLILVVGQTWRHEFCNIVEYMYVYSNLLKATMSIHILVLHIVIYDVYRDIHSTRSNLLMHTFGINFHGTYKIVYMY